VISTTAPYASKAVDELPGLWDGFALLVRAGLGISAFGANIMVLPPDYTTEPHDESDTGQQELYVALAGSGTVDVDGARLTLDPDHLVRVDAGTARTLSSGPGGLRILCVGGVPGAAYRPPDWSSGSQASVEDVDGVGGDQHKREQ
jgi:mannose-6-phosphate isomerase-like protein (cupin superfamily)